MDESSNLNDKVISLDRLPDELLIEIFERLRLRDQTRLASCCSRFQSINCTKVRRKFDAIVVFWGDSYQFINTFESYKTLKKAKCFMHKPTDEGQFEIDEWNESLFDKASTNVLEITVKATDDRPFLLLSRVFKTLQYASLEIDFTVSERNNLAILQCLMSSRNLSDACLIIKWSRALFDDIERTRQFLCEYPPVKSLDLTWIYWGTNADSLATEVVTDDILLYLAGQCRDELLVGEGDCSLRGLMSVYEKLQVVECKLVRVTVRSELAAEFRESSEGRGKSAVTVLLEKSLMHEIIEMRQIVMTKEPEKHDDSF